MLMVQQFWARGKGRKSGYRSCSPQLAQRHANFRPAAFDVAGLLPAALATFTYQSRTVRSVREKAVRDSCPWQRLPGSFDFPGTSMTRTVAAAQQLYDLGGGPALVPPG
jgi:hypothetical protein